MANLNIPSTRDRTLDAFKGKMVGGGARPNLFECELFFPDDAIPVDSSKDEIADKSRFLVKAAQLPASNIAGTRKTSQVISHCLISKFLMAPH